MKRFLVFTAVLLLIGTGYFTYKNWVEHADLSVWSFLPGNALVVYESNQALNNLMSARSTATWQNIATIPPLSEIPKRLLYLDTIAGKGNFLGHFENIPSLISLHITSSASFDLLYILEIKNLTQHTYLSKALAHFRDLNYTKKSREYLGFTVIDISSPDNDLTFSYVFFKNYFIGSFSAFLVEDAVRTIANTDSPTYQEKFKELFTLARLEKDFGNLYLNTSRLPAFLETFGSDKSSLNLASSSYLDLRIDDDVINLSGFTFAKDQGNYLSVFNDIGGNTFDLAEMIPSSAAWAYHMSFDDNIRFGKAMSNYLSIRENDLTAQKKELLDKYDFDIDHFYSLLDGEVGVVTLESKSSYQQDKLLILEVMDMGESLNFFNTMTERFAVANNDTIYHEKYGEIEIRKLPVDGFPALLLGDIASDFGQTYYLSYRNYLVFSNSVYQLKSLLEDIDEEEVWNKSLRFNRFLDRSNKEANLSLFVNTPRAWSRLMSGLKPEWKAFFGENQYAMRNLEYLAFQFSYIDNKFYTNITAYQPNRSSTGTPISLESEKAISLPGKVITKPYLVTNHYTRRWEVILQDTSYHVYLISSDFEALWSVDAGEAVNSDFFQIDYYKNGKLQYAFTTGKSIHVIDRTGEYLPGFPASLPGEAPIKSFNIIDYDNSRNYRFALTDDKGNIYLTNKDGNPLEGWKPMRTGSNVQWPLQHNRVSGSDFLAFIQTDGRISLKTRRGENCLGFPVDTEVEIFSDFFLQRGNTVANTRLITVTNGGELFELNFQGNITRREQLYKPSANTTYSLIHDVTGDGFLIIRNTDRRYEVLDENADLLFTKDYFSQKPMIIQYYKLGGSVEWIVFLDRVEQNLYIYNREGQLLTGGPLRSGVPISVLQFENNYQVYLAEGNELTLIKIPK